MAAIGSVKPAQPGPQAGRFEEWIRLRHYLRYAADRGHGPLLRSVPRPMAAISQLLVQSEYLSSVENGAAFSMGP